MERIDAIVRDPLFQECLAKTAEIEKEREFCKHDLQHFVDVARITYILILESGALWSFIRDNDLKGTREAKEVVYAAGILHDIGRWRQYETGEDHSAVGARYAGEIMERAGFTPNEIRIVTRAILEHREHGDQMTLLGELLHRADNLSRACHECSAQKKCYKFPTMETGNLVLIY
ncbi:MAG: uncharacterized protein PWQ99_1344 [Clostridia bacterium]|jgi:HD superfamily phosphodiesterase|uniref:HD domain-containing protein n=1 Tax=Thermacetogenium phaeum TaxID=85874 RepID=A0A117LB35_9THEO|nr:MAG: Uncharacterized protein XD66_0965 [Thermacetogenium phaeum]MDK2881569.1 uncharacterized protein [Clostridia bacterium]MDN5366549.1 uncharacterized protein [Thermacetogenium sp.]MDN5376292.1 uncharacterized protein [Thermacetogenium sp.]